MSCTIASALLGTGLPNVDDYADPAGSHIARLIDACWRIGRPTHTPTPLSSRPVPDRPRPGDRRTPFDTAWTCHDCATRTRYAACPVCVAERQASLDAQRSQPVPADSYTRLRRWAHMLGYGGHFLTKARRYSVTFRLLRETRIAFRRVAERDQAVGDRGSIRAADHHGEETTLIVGILTFAGVGWHTSGDALLANTAATVARARRGVGREEMAYEIGAAIQSEQLLSA
jgi:hypothetical protein